MSSLRMHCPFLLHRMDEPQTRAWFLSESHRRRVGDMLAKKYGQDFGILGAGYELIAKVDRRGAVTLLPPPFAEYHFSLIANKPGVGTCPCRNFYDPESEGPWHRRGSEEHHPLCQFDRTSEHVYAEAVKRGESRVNDGLSAQSRPDEWERLRREYRGR